MAYQGDLIIQGRIYNVLECDYEFNQPIDNNFKPSAYPQGGLITFTLNSVNEEDTFFHDWMMSISEVKEGTLKFPISEGIIHKWKLVNFKYAHCIHLSEHFSEHDARHMTMKITICAALINFGGKAEFRNRDLKK